MNQAFATHFFSGEDPVGKRLLSADQKQLSEIVGVVSDYRPMGAGNGTRPQIFWPYLKLASATLIVRSAAAPKLLAKPPQGAIWSLTRSSRRKKS